MVLYLYDVLERLKGAEGSVFVSLQISSGAQVTVLCDVSVHVLPDCV